MNMEVLLLFVFSFSFVSLVWHWFCLLVFWVGGCWNKFFFHSGVVSD